MSLSNKVDTAIVVHLLREYFNEWNECFAMFAHGKIDSQKLEEALNKLDLDYASKIIEGLNE